MSSRGGEKGHGGHETLSQGRFVGQQGVEGSWVKIKKKKIQHRGRGIGGQERANLIQSEEETNC